MPQKNPSDMDISLLMAKLIHTDLVHAGAPSWGYWKAFEINGDHALTGVYPKNGDICQGGSVFTRKKLWVLGNYSFFIRPGWKRVELSGADNLGGVFASAFMSPDGKKVAVVAVNVSYEPADFNFSLEGKGAENLKKVGRNQLPAKKRKKAAAKLPGIPMQWQRRASGCVQISVY